MTNDRISRLVKRMSVLECLYIVLHSDPSKPYHWLEFHGITDLEEKERQQYFASLKGKAIKGVLLALTIVALWVWLYWFLGVFPFSH